MYEKTQRDDIPVEMVQSSSELEGHLAEEEGVLECVHEMEERVMKDFLIDVILWFYYHPIATIVLLLFISYLLVGEYWDKPAGEVPAWVFM